VCLAPTWLSQAAAWGFLFDPPIVYLPWQERKIEFLAEQEFHRPIQLPIPKGGAMGRDNDIKKFAKAFSQLGASKGGKARARSLTPEQRSEIARRAVTARWQKAGKAIVPRPSEAALSPPVENAAQAQFSEEQWEVFRRATMEFESLGGPIGFAVITALSEGRRDIAELASRIGINRVLFEGTLPGLAGAGLIRRNGKVYSLTGRGSYWHNLIRHFTADGPSGSSNAC